VTDPATKDLDATRAVEFSHDSSGAGRVASARPPASAGPAGTSSEGRDRAAEEAVWPVVRYVSLFAGVEAFSVAASRIAGAKWEPVFFSEIDPFPCAVLAHRFPGVPNLGDVCKIQVRETADGKKEITNGTASIPFPAGGIDILAGGSPCQDVSLAGLRRGFADGTRSSLAFEYARLVGELRPRVLLWENVPGVLSSRGGRDFAALVRRLDELGYGIAWRVLDVQWTRVDGPMPGGGWGGFPRAIPQRRDRVWIVGLARASGMRAGEILFERYGVPGHSPPRREAGQGFAAPPGYCPALAAQARGGAGEAQRGGWSVGNGQLNSAEPETVCKTLDAMNDPQKIVRRLSAPTTAADSADKAPRGGSSPSASASFDGTDCAPTLHRPNGSPGQSDQEIFSQGGAYLARTRAGDRDDG
jgi:site-specific DNA-cytosine methylase